MTEQVIVVPDIGTDDEVSIIEINVKVGDSVDEEDTLITLESEKASMEIPAPMSGTIANIIVSVGDKVKSGKPIMTLTTITSEKTNTESLEQVELESQASVVSVPDTDKDTDISKISRKKNIEIRIPDIGTDNKVVVIEVLVKPGDVVNFEDSLITLESEKASMDVPSPATGIIKELKVNLGDKVGVGDLIAILETVTSGASNLVTNEIKKTAVATAPAQQKPQKPQPVTSQAQDLVANASSNKHVYASPSIRRFANDLGVDLSRVVGTGRKNRILISDVETYVKTQLAKIQSGAATVSQGSIAGLDIIALPEIDFSKFGEVSVKPLSRIKKLSAANLHRNWVVVPHVTQFDEADITEMEDFRQKYKKQAQDRGYKLTPLVFLMRAAAQALKLMPQFNVSLSNDGKSIIQKSYYHIGIAIDTPNGLVVPVIRDVDQKGLFQLSQELADISKKARDGKLLAKDMIGGCFTISSLGGIGGSAFTPIVNVPEVAILGISKSQIKPIYQNSEFVPRLMLPLSLSYDHRAIDGADAARFITNYSKLLGDISQLLL